MNQEPAEFWVVLQQPGQPDTTFALDRDEIRFGRDPSNNDLTLDDLQVSRRHGRFIRQPDGFMLEDLGSTNGTFVNGRRLAPNQPRLLCDGDTITLSDKLIAIYRMRAVEVGQPAMPPPEANEWLASLSDEQKLKWPQPPTQTDDDYGPKLSDADTAILSPAPGSFVRGLVPILGNAKGDGFNAYHLAFGPGLSPTQWTPIGGEHNQQVDHGQLETWDASKLDGLHSLQLTVTRNGQPEQVTVQVTADNIAPTVAIVYPVDERIYGYPANEWVSIQTEAWDNYSLERVEFYVDSGDKPVAVRTIAPYNAKWTISGVGRHTLWAVAYDAAGNRAESQRVTIVVQGVVPEYSLLTPATTSPSTATPAPGPMPVAPAPAQAEVTPTGSSNRLMWILALAGCALMVLCLAALTISVIVLRQRGLF